MASFKTEKVATPYSFTPVVGGLDSPTYVTTAPGDPDTLYVVEQSGAIRIVRDGKIAGTFLDVHKLIVSGGEQGLLSMAFGPQYASNHLFYRRHALPAPLRAEGASDSRAGKEDGLRRVLLRR